MQGGWQPPPGGGGGGYGPPPGGGWTPPGATQQGPAGYAQQPQQAQPPGPGGYPPQQSYGQNPYGQNAPMGPPGMQAAYGSYEFNEYENSVIDKTASRAKLWGIISIVVGALQLFGTCGAIGNPMLLTCLPGGIGGIVVGVTFLGAGNAFKSIVTTQGNDMQYLMQALQKITTSFTVQMIVLIVSVVLMGIVIVGLLVFVVAAAATSH